MIACPQCGEPINGVMHDTKGECMSKKKVVKKVVHKPALKIVEVKKIETPAQEVVACMLVETAKITELTKTISGAVNSMQHNLPVDIGIAVGLLEVQTVKLNALVLKLIVK